MNRNDRAALKLAVEQASQESEARAQQIAEMLKSRDWEEVASFCSTVAQSRSLNLRPWQVAPCDFHPADLDADWRRGGQAASDLLERMRRHNISKYHPDPLAALQRAEASQPWPAR